MTPGQKRNLAIKQRSYPAKLAAYNRALEEFLKSVDEFVDNQR
jgi:hypothetical protein